MNNNIQEQNKIRKVRLPSSYFSDSETEITKDSNAEFVEIEISHPVEEQRQQMKDYNELDVESIQQAQVTTVSQNETIMASQYGKETNILTTQEKQPDRQLISPEVSSLHEDSSTQEGNGKDEIKKCENKLWSPHEWFFGHESHKSLSNLLRSLIFKNYSTFDIVESINVTTDYCEYIFDTSKHIFGDALRSIGEFHYLERDLFKRVIKTQRLNKLIPVQRPLEYLNKKFKNLDWTSEIHYMSRVQNKSCSQIIRELRLRCKLEKDTLTPVIFQMEFEKIAGGSFTEQELIDYIILISEMDDKLFQGLYSIYSEIENTPDGEYKPWKSRHWNIENLLDIKIRDGNEDRNKDIICTPKCTTHKRYEADGKISWYQKFIRNAIYDAETQTQETLLTTLTAALLNAHGDGRRKQI